MIRVNEDWIIDVDAYNYILKKDAHKQTKQKSGNGYVMADTFYVVGYYSTLSAALDTLGKEMFKDKISTSCYSLAEAVAALQECRDVWEKLLKEVKGVVKWQI